MVKAIRGTIGFVACLSLVGFGAPAPAERRSEEIVAAFSRDRGFFPESGIIEGPDGALYGTTLWGPTSNKGCIGGCGVDPDGVHDRLAPR